jgi:hypothetical protein
VTARFKTGRHDDVDARTFQCDRLIDGRRGANGGDRSTTTLVDDMRELALARGASGPGAPASMMLASYYRLLFIYLDKPVALTNTLEEAVDVFASRFLQPQPDLFLRHGIVASQFVIIATEELRPRSPLLDRAAADGARLQRPHVALAKVHLHREAFIEPGRNLSQSIPVPHAMMYLGVQLLVREDIDVMAFGADDDTRTVRHKDCARIRTRAWKELS